MGLGGCRLPTDEAAEPTRQGSGQRAVLSMRRSQAIALGETGDADSSVAHLNQIGEGSLHPPKKHDTPDQQEAHNTQTHRHHSPVGSRLA